MYCDQCGNELAAGAKFCSKCGEELTSVPIAPDPDSPSDDSVAQPEGIGGWLMLLIVVFVVMYPLTSSYYVISELNFIEANRPQMASMSSWDTYTMATWIVTSITIALSINAGYLLFTKRLEKVVYVAIGTFWLIQPVTGLVDIALWAAIIGQPTFTDLFFDSVPLLVGQVGASSVWTAYLLFSERVANTYVEPSP